MTSLAVWFAAMIAAVAVPALALLATRLLSTREPAPARRGSRPLPGAG